MRTYIEETLGLTVEKFKEMVIFVVDSKTCTINRLQSKFCIGFNKAMKIVNKFEEMGIVSKPFATEGRKVLVTMEETTSILNKLDEN